MLVPTFVALGALRAKGASAVAQWGLWLGVVALAVGVIGALVPLWDKLRGTAHDQGTGAEDVGKVEDELAGVVLDQAQVARSRLLGADEIEDQAANVRFVKGTGRFREVGGASTGDLETIREYYQSLSPQRLVILGEPGAGKTVLAMELLVSLLEQRKKDKGLPVPVLISAAAYDTGRQWEEWLGGHLAHRFNMGAGTAARLVRDRRVLPVVDGLDEMDVAGEPERARAAVAALNSFMQGRERAAVVVTCRREEYQALRPGVDKATHIEMVPLDGRESAGYLANQLRGTEEKQAWEPVLTCLRADPGGLLAAQLATPWRLTLALTVFRDGGSPAELLPGPILDPYAQRVNTLLLGRYIPSTVRLHDTDGHYSPNQVQQWLTGLAKGLAWQALHDGSATDIELHEWWQPTARRGAPLIHIVLLGVFAAPWLVAASLRRDAAFFLVGGLLAFFAVTAGMRTTARRLSFRQLTTGYGLQRIVRRLARWLAIGLVLGLALGLWRGHVVIYLVAGLVVMFVWGLTDGLEAALDDTAPEAVEPRDVIRASGYFGLVFGLLQALVIGGLVSFFFSLKDALLIGLSFGIVIGFGFSGDAWLRYYITVVIAAVRGSEPLRFGASLDWVYKAGLLRLSGAGYQFRHRQLQDWLTSPDADRGGGMPTSPS